MPLKPSVILDVPAGAPSMKKAIGRRLAKAYTANPKVVMYAFVLKFPDGVVTGRSVSHALSKLPTPRGPTILAGESFTVEAMELPRQTAVRWLPLKSTSGPMSATQLFAKASNLIGNHNGSSDHPQFNRGW